MLLKVLKNTGVTLLTMVVLFSTMSFSVHKHFCGPFLKDVSVIVPSHGCGMESDMKMDSCKISKKKSCCNDIVELVEGQDDLKVSFDSIDFEQQQFIIAFTHSYIYLISGDCQLKTTFTAYSPPLVTHDIPVLYQSFLI